MNIILKISKLNAKNTCKQTDKMKKNPKQTINKMKRNKTNKPNENKLELTFILTTKQLH